MPMWLWWAVPAAAWDTSGVPAWDEPLAFELAAQSEGLAPAGNLQAARRAAALWSDVPCADLEITVSEGGSGRSRQNDVHEITFEALEAGTLLGVTFHGGAVIKPDHSVVTEITEVDLALQTEGVTWLTDAQASDADCADESYSLPAVMTHAMGHAAGLATTDASSATMARLRPCDTSSSSLYDDDRLGLQSLYGHLAVPDCTVDGTSDLRGATPLTVACSVVADDGVDFSVVWETASDRFTGAVLQTTFETAGLHALDGCATVRSDEACTPLCVRHEALACDPPEAAIDIHRDGALTTLRNETPLVSAGCVDDVRWEVFDDQGRPWAVRDDWEPSLVLPAGSWSATLWVSGVAGEDQAELAWTTSGCSCTTRPSAGPMGLAWLLGLLGLVALRRGRPGAGALLLLGCGGATDPSTTTPPEPSEVTSSEGCPDVPDGCDGIDVDCDGQVDEDPDVIWHQDGDADGGGDPSSSMLSCSSPGKGWVRNDADCSDINPAVNGSLGPVHWSPVDPAVSGLTEAHWDGVRSRCSQEPFMGGAAIADVDDDGDLDVFLPRMALPDRLMLNDGAGRFTIDPLFDGKPSHSSGAVFFDAEGDGDLDLYVTQLEADANLLYINDGSGIFSEEATQRGADRSTQGDCSDQYGVSAVDVDADGDLDLAIAGWQESWRLGEVNRSALLINDGTGHFTEQTEPWGLADLHQRAPFSLLFHDLDADTLPDMHVVADWQTSGVLANDGTSFSALPDDVFTEESGMGADLGDVDGDGDLDWFVSAIYSPRLVCLNGPCTGNRMYRRADDTYVDDTDAAGVRIGQWSWGAVFVDMDLDADLDLAVTAGFDAPEILHLTGNVYRNDGTGRFEDATCETGFTVVGQGRTLLAFDMDRDGDQDLLLVQTVLPASVWEATGAEGRSSMTVELRQPGGNPFGIGALVTVRAEPEGPEQVRLLHANSLFMGGPPPEVHVGLADHEGPVHEVRVRWPDGDTTVHRDVPLGHATLVRDEATR
ncbi:MAG: VCBS repeat-containing protein [Myxococcales bacterium]|nr:VCBS repeat-containing protein [Myxococcales bacterium]